MRPLVLNAWTKVAGPTSSVHFESTARPSEVRISRPEGLSNGDSVLRVTLEGLGLAMSPDEIVVADGVIRTLAVLDSQPATADLVLEFRVEPSSVNITPGLPWVTELVIPRQSLTRVFAGRTVALDPGHGGRDRGVRGPVNLLEKNVALDIAKELKAMLEAASATVVMSRDSDRDVSLRDWTSAVLASRPDILVEIHASSEEDPMARSYHVFSRRGSGESRLAAREIACALKERMGIVFASIEERDFPVVPHWPAVRVEPVCLTHFVDEANFRAPLFRRRIAQSIFNGLSRYFRTLDAGGAEGVQRVG